MQSLIWVSVKSIINVKFIKSWKHRHACGRMVNEILWTDEKLIHLIQYLKSALNHTWTVFLPLDYHEHFKIEHNRFACSGFLTETCSPRWGFPQYLKLVLKHYLEADHDKSLPHCVTIFHSVLYNFCTCYLKDSHDGISKSWIFSQHTRRL
jgi:hypothetical protein